ncbi:MAG: response regulator [Desulfosarcinaceae bacterium]|jgi:signal transduction histidine kinase/FixJ family two-component response regulator
MADAPLNDISVLVVDDEQGIRDGSERILKRMDCRVHTAKNGEEGLAVIETEVIDILLLDLKMPGIDGMEVLARVSKSHPHILVIVITGFATVETAIEAMKQGAYDFIPKPFDPDQLRLVTARAAEKVHLRRDTERLEAERRRNLKDLDTEKSRMATIIDSLPNGVIVTNADGEVVLMNPSLQRYLGLSETVTSGVKVCELIKDEGLCDLIMDISTGRYVDFDDIPTYEFSLDQDTFLMARGLPVLGENRECLGAVTNIMDVTTIRVLDRLKSEFVAKVSHELRSPLSTIHEQLALVLSDLIGQVSESDAHLLSRAKEKTKGLISLIGDLLDISRIEAGAVCQETKPIQLEELLGNIVDFMQARAQAKKQTLTLDRPESPLPQIKADPLALESIFGNLIANAINYTPDDGEIAVTAAMSGINLGVSVRDNGFGMEERHLEKIFERFYRIKTDKTRYITGTGLGLPIVKGLVDSLGGRISVESVPEKGSTFTVLLPVAS